MVRSFHRVINIIPYVVKFSVCKCLVVRVENGYSHGNMLVDP